MPTRPAARDEPAAPSRERLATAALRMFADHGFDTTTVEDIADAAGVSRRTFFRHFRSKEDVIFPDHDRLRALVSDQLEMRRNEPPLDAAFNAVRLVLADYVRRKEISLHRFALTRQVPALREREVANVYTYQRLFARYLRERLPGVDELDVELMAATVVAAHNAALRTWLRSGGATDAYDELERAARRIQRLFLAGTHPGAATDTDDTTPVPVFRRDAPMPARVRA